MPSFTELLQNAGSTQRPPLQEPDRQSLAWLHFMRPPQGLQAPPPQFQSAKDKGRQTAGRQHRPARITCIDVGWPQRGMRQSSLLFWLLHTAYHECQGMLHGRLTSSHNAPPCLPPCRGVKLTGVDAPVSRPSCTRLLHEVASRHLPPLAAEQIRLLHMQVNACL